MSTLVTRDRVETLVRSIILKQLGTGSSANGNGHVAAQAYKPKVVVNISARHCHLTQADVDILFGPGHQLTPMRRLYQDTDFAANETVAVVGTRQRMIPEVRILGPCRKFSQVELAFTDAISVVSMPRCGSPATSKERQAACSLVPRAHSPCGRASSAPRDTCTWDRTMRNITESSTWID